MVQQLNFTLLPLPPVTKLIEETPLITPPDTQKLQLDMINVVEGRVPIETFEPEYQKKIKDYYRFSATRATTQYPVCAKRTRDTLDIV